MINRRKLLKSVAIPAAALAIPGAIPAAALAKTAEEYSEIPDYIALSVSINDKGVFEFSIRDASGGYCCFYCLPEDKGAQIHIEPRNGLVAVHMWPDCREATVFQTGKGWLHDYGQK